MRWTRLRFIGAAALPVILFGCVHTDVLAPRTSPSSKTAFSPPADSVPRAVETPAFQLPPGLAAAKRPWTLAELIDIGLSNNMQTRMAWSAARSAAAALGAVRGAFFPRVAVDLTATKINSSTDVGRLVAYDYSSLTPSAGLSWLLIDFGGRSGLTEEARDALAAANWTQNAVLQNVILLIEQNYYQYVAAKALLAAQETSHGEAEKNLEAAETRRRAGVATLADTLQARTVLSSIQLELVTTQGLIQTSKGVLANSLGLPADAAFEIDAELPASLPVAEAAGSVERRIAEALVRRPDLAAARALALKAAAHVETVRAQGLPTINFNGSFGRIFYNTPAQSNALSAALVLDIPLFHGWTVAYEALQAEMDAETMRAQLKKSELDVGLQVWTSYFNVQTSAQRIRTAQDLLNLAQQSYDVALGSYKEGVNSILDLLAAQSALENGRVQVVQAKAQWLLALVQFARDSGTLDPPGGAAARTDKGDR
jgi:outer membrane protein TolC